MIPSYEKALINLWYSYRTHFRDNLDSSIRHNLNGILRGSVGAMILVLSYRDDCFSDPEVRETLEDMRFLHQLLDHEALDYFLR